MVLRPDSFAHLCHARELLAQVREVPLSIKAVAREACMSPFHFSRQFEALFGVTPHQFRIGARLDSARVLLAKGDLNVTEVCMEVGMSSLGSFSDLFTRRIGTSPSEFQRRARIVVAVPGLAHPVFPGCYSLLAHLPASAFRTFQEAEITPPLLKLTHAHQAHQHHGRRPGQGTAVLHPDARLPEEAGNPHGTLQVVDRGFAGSAG